MSRYGLYWGLWGFMKLCGANRTWYATREFEVFICPHVLHGASLGLRAGGGGSKGLM